MNLADYLSKNEISQTTFAELVGVSQGMVYQWLAGKRPVSAEKCPVIERLTGGLVKCEELNSDVDWEFVRASRGQNG